MSTEVACDFTSTGRVPHMDRVFQVKLLGELREIVRVGVHFVAVPGLRGTAVASPVVRDDTISALSEEQHLGVPVVRRQRPAVAENDRLPLPPVLVEDCRAIFGPYRCHRKLSFRVVSKCCSLTFPFGHKRYCGQCGRQDRSSANQYVASCEVGHNTAPSLEISSVAHPC